MGWAEERGGRGVTTRATAAKSTTGRTRAPRKTATTQGKASPLGPGAGVLMTEYTLPTVLGNTPQARMQRSLKVGIDVDWVRSAERVISARVAGCAWHLEDPDGSTIDDEWKGPPAAQDLRKLLEEPQAALAIEEVGIRQTRRQQMDLTSRHMGLAGQGAWMLDQFDGRGLPTAILYVRPDRLFPEQTPKGVLKEWRLDKRPGDPGLEIPITDLILFRLQPPDAGVFAPGLVESAFSKATNSGLIDKHFTSILASGGRLSGVLAPKTGAIENDTIYQELERDWRNIVEQPDAARRVQIVRAPVDFTQTVMDANQMALADFMDRNRDALLALWGVPLTMLNGQNAGSTGLNGGESRKYDEAALWQGAVQMRLDEIAEVITAGVIERFREAIGWVPCFVWDTPSFDDEAPKYTMAQAAQGLPLRNSERRAIVGLDPFGDPVLDNAVWMPMSTTELALAPDEDGKPVEKPEPEQPDMDPEAMEAMLAAQQAPAPGQPGGPVIPPGKQGGPGQLPSEQILARLGAKAAALGAAKASLDSVRIMPVGTKRLRAAMEKAVVPRAREAVQAALEAQADDIARAIEDNWEHIVRSGGNDVAAWWRPSKIDRALKPAMAGVAEQVAEHLGEAFGGTGTIH